MGCEEWRVSIARVFRNNRHFTAVFTSPWDFKQTTEKPTVAAALCFPYKGDKNSNFGNFLADAVLVERSKLTEDGVKAIVTLAGE